MDELLCPDDRDNQIFPLNLNDSPIYEAELID